jgi:hypothetical protein
MNTVYNLLDNLDLVAYGITQYLKSIKNTLIKDWPNADSTFCLLLHGQHLVQS